MGIDKDKSLPAATELRRQAEEKLRAKTADSHPSRTKGETLQRVHELEVHQVELEMQNEELRRVQQELELERNKFAELYDFAPVGYFTFDDHGLIRAVNLTGTKLMGMERRLLVNKPFIHFLADKDNREIFSSHLESVLKDQGIQACEIKLTKKDGTLMYGQLQSVRMDTAEKKGGHIFTSMVDCTAGKLAAQRIGEVIGQQQAILDNIPNIAWLKDKEGRYIAVNDPFCSTFGVKTKHELIGKNDFDIHPPELAVKYEKEFKEVMTTGRRAYFQETIIDRDGKTQYVEKIKTPVFNDKGAVIGVIGIVHDITLYKEEEISLRHHSSHDILTGLYNRAFFNEELERLGRGRMFPISIVSADVNGLKTVNDTLGHKEGDNLIQLAARIIRRAFRAEDIVARVGGDEFTVLLPKTDKNIAEKAVEKIERCPEITQGLVSIALGIATAKNKGQLAEALKLSDKRMYLDKATKKGLQARGTRGDD